MDTIISTLEIAEKALDGVPVPAVKAAVGSLLVIFKRIDVRLLAMRTQRWLTMYYHRRVIRTRKRSKSSGSMSLNCALMC